jgi:hypothetical protein
MTCTHARRIILGGPSTTPGKWAAVCADCHAPLWLVRRDGAVVVEPVRIRALESA